MNYNLCDLLNTKMEVLFDYYDDNSKLEYKHKDQIEKHIEENYADDFLALIDKTHNINIWNAFWVYRNGKFSKNIHDYDIASKKIIRELSNLTYSYNPSLDIMYFSGVLKMIYKPDFAIYLETASKPSLDQIMAIKDFQMSKKVANENVYWKVWIKRNKNIFDLGVGVNKLFEYNWSKVK